MRTIEFGTNGDKVDHDPRIGSLEDDGGYEIEEGGCGIPRNTWSSQGS
jgi:hypothetical protein